MLICSKCGYDNQLGRIFCHSCGEKLDLTSVKPPTAAEKTRRKVKRGIGRTLRMILGLAITGGSILGIILICMTPSVAPVVPTDNELMASDEKRMSLEKLINRHKPGHVLVTEGELNAFFNHQPFAPPTGTGVQLAPVALRLNLSDGHIKINFLGVAHFGTVFDKNLSFSCEGQPVVTGGKFSFKLTGIWLGKLPIHPGILAAATNLKSQFIQPSGELRYDKELLDKLSAINVTHESVELVVTAPPAH